MICYLVGSTCLRNPAECAVIIVLIGVINYKQCILACFKVQFVSFFYLITVDGYDRIVGFNKRVVFKLESRYLYTAIDTSS